MAKKSGIYTKTGDRGHTSLIGGRRVPKYHTRIEAYGTVDELMAHTSLLRDMLDGEQAREDLLAILDMQMATASVLATDMDSLPEEIPTVGASHIRFLENRIDEMDASLEPLTSFVLPGGHPAVSQAHVARTVCRRLERVILKLASEADIAGDIIRFYNRLSDYYFVLSRKIASDLGIRQTPWRPRL